MSESKIDKRRDSKGRFRPEGEEFAAVFTTRSGGVQFVPILKEHDSEEADRIEASWEDLTFMGFGVIVGGNMGRITRTRLLRLDGEGRVRGLVEKSGTSRKRG